MRRLRLSSSFLVINTPNVFACPIPLFMYIIRNYGAFKRADATRRAMKFMVMRLC